MTKLTPELIKAINAWIKKYAKHIDDNAQATADVMHDLCIDQQYEKAVFTLIDKWILNH